MTHTAPHYPIGDLAKRTGTKVQTIRYYESIGLLPEPARTSGNQRIYGQDQLDRLAFIKHARDFGFPLDAIRELLEMTDRPAASCAEADAICRRHLTEVRRRIGRLQALEGELKRMVETCSHGTVADCRVISVLSDHEKCCAEEHEPVETMPYKATA
ncbi:MAG: helix-turn-helix domain-containing protein [Nisaea sp.]|jgi:DNA-binding transcriptional MerR regulator|uniref:MerR family transcriptional regulator n=1 Tax=Nisaea sp. TaxID=2024842 RepID=UPI001B07B0C8|nr:helix-turn-helix domain-containing protein [Nisaea sp.]MBO6560321.1 helix-turn-helix domain-containing protein [Nisaea sp.]